MKINLFFFISNFNFGGAGNAIYVFLKKLSTKKFNLHLICIGKSEYKKFLPKHVKFYSFDNKVYFFKTFFNFFKIKKIIKNFSQKKEKNIFISNIHYSNVLSIFFLRKLKNLKIVLFERTSLNELDIFINLLSFVKNKIVKILIRFTYKKSDKILSNSKVLQSEFHKINLKSEVVYSGALEQILKSKKLKKKNYYNLVSVGRLAPQKDYFTLFKAIKLTKKNNFILRIYGEGELKESLKKYIYKHSLEKKIILMGHESNRKRIYKNADLLIHSSVFEGLPNVIVEALNYSVPVIAANGAGGIREVLCFGKYGQLFKTGDFKVLAKNIDNFILNPNNLNKKVLNSKFYLKRFTHENCTKSLEKILMRI